MPASTIFLTHPQGIKRKAHKKILLYYVEGSLLKSVCALAHVRSSFQIVQQREQWYKTETKVT